MARKDWLPPLPFKFTTDALNSFCRESLGVDENMPVRMSRLAGRNDFPRFLNEQNLTGIAVEVGSHQGVYAKEFLSKWKGEKLFCIDPYIQGYDPHDPAGAPDRDRNPDKELLKRNLLPFKDRYQLVELPSVEAAEFFEDLSLDFVYVDANHTYPAVKRDILAWWRKVKEGGLLAGHDIVSGTRPGHGHGKAVSRAVTEFARNRNLWVDFVAELPRRNWSWYIQKTK